MSPSALRDMPILSYKDGEMRRKAGTQLLVPPAPGKQWLPSQIVPETQDTFGKQLASRVCTGGDSQKPSKSGPLTYHW